MDILPIPYNPATAVIKTVEMHTSGEPARIIYSGFPELSGTLLQQRALARDEHDHIRRALILEPRGHRDMYGGALRPKTELVGPDPDQAHMGVLFLTGDGYSTMCGHVTFAVSRFLIDTTDALIFPLRHTLDFQDEGNGKGHVELRLHVPCGLVRVTVPTVKAASGEWQTDTERLIGYLSTPSFVVATNLSVPLPQSMRWHELGGKTSVTVDIAYGGAFFIIVRADELGFPTSLETPDLAALDEATINLKRAFNSSSELRDLLQGTHPDLAFMYAVIITEAGAGERLPGTAGVETGICYFGTSTELPQQIDRSPCGSGTQARVALAVAQGRRALGESWTYHSALTRKFGDQGAFTGKAMSDGGMITAAGGDIPSVLVEVSGRAHYAGAASFMVETDDKIGRGFSFV